MKSYLINQNDAGQRVSKFVEKTVPALPPSLLYKYFRLKRIKLNKKRCQPQDRLLEGDLVELYINDEFFGEGRQDLAFLKVPDKLTIIYEDENILLVDKKPGLVVHEDDDNTPDTLINRILHYLYNKGEYNPQAEQSFVPALCNRIDRNTGGIVIAAKNAEALRVMNEKIAAREIEKYYLCVVVGRPRPAEGRLEDFIFKDAAKNRVYVRSKPEPGARTAVTYYKTLDSRGGLSLVECRLGTGRTHQIRAQMAHAGTPLLGDGKYGDGKRNRALDESGQLLYSYRVDFDFKTDAGELNYLKGAGFKVEKVGFVDKYFPGAKF